MNFQEPYLLAMQDQAPKMARYPIEPPQLTLQIGIIEAGGVSKVVEIG